MVVAMQWVNQVTTIALEMVLPAWLGHWLDGRWGTEPWLVAIGGLLGFGAAMAHLMAIARRAAGKKSGNGQPGKTPGAD
jgi:F0F1-type ATP synthase assembly protein I